MMIKVLLTFAALLPCMATQAGTAWVQAEERERELREFASVCLAPGETKTVTFALPPEAFALYDADLKRVVEPGDFTIFVGGDSTTTNVVRLTLKTR